MTEFWKSQAKYYCKCCNSWMADNKMVCYTSLLCFINIKYILMHFRVYNTMKVVRNIKSCMLPLSKRKEMRNSMLQGPPMTCKSS